MLLNYKAPIGMKLMKLKWIFSCLLYLSWLLTVAISSVATAAQRDEVVFFFNDALGSAVAAVNEAGELCWHENYSPYGEKMVGDDVFSTEGCGIVGEERGFTSHTVDYDTDLTYMQQRYYDPTIGRFLSVDPVGIRTEQVPSLNRYGYAYNNPLRYTDPTGEIPVETIWDALSVVYDVGKIGVGYATGNSSLVSDGLLDLAADAAALAIPYVPAGSTKAVRALGKVGDGVPKSGPISVDEALGKASNFLKNGVPVRSIDGKTGVQFIQEFTENGKKITKRAGLDLNPNSSHVKQLGPHLNLQTQISDRIQKGALAVPHIPIDPKTIRSGDY